MTLSIRLLKIVVKVKPSGENFSIKQLEKSKKSIRQKLDKLNDQTKKDDVVTFEELGVDRLFVDESHYYKNLYLYTKMRNVGGIAPVSYTHLDVYKRQVMPYGDKSQV